VIGRAIDRKQCRGQANPNLFTPHDDSTVIIDRIPPAVKKPPSAITRPRSTGTGSRGKAFVERNVCLLPGHFGSDPAEVGIGGDEEGLTVLAEATVAGPLPRS
jgi:hypothetical protein